jgi:hypothetical protein
VSLVVRMDPMEADGLPAVDYRWDADTEILTAALRAATVGEGLTGSMDIEGADGAWLMLELKAGRLASVEVAVWPDVHLIEDLMPPAPAGVARLAVPLDGGGVAALEVDTPMSAVADEAERTIHFRIGPPRASRPLQVARDLLVEVDARSELAGLWLLNVPPSPMAL